ncbi:MAG: uracil-DNA glycosylase [Fimbriimonadales bacterium]|nr:uracil-DNA glycosylase [Fimbriimonadales bacterium]MDW8051158.1 uracil-DNA glycosylase [Armatimonadota bacterium]
MALPPPSDIQAEWDALNQQLIACACCPRLVAYREQVAQTKRAAFRAWEYWGKPVPNFGSPDARLLIVGLAPAAHGGNRTGRIFTGDASGDFLFEALYRAGFCNQPTSTHRDDGLTLYDVALTATVHCAPPQNKPTREEQANCFPYLLQTYRLMPNLRGMLALGQLAFEACVRLARHEQLLPAAVRPTFRHGAFYELRNGMFLAASYHPSARNTYTKLLTMPMMIELLHTIRARLSD